MGSGRVFVYATPPKTSIFGYLKVKAIQMSHAVRELDMSEGQGYIPYMEKHVLLEDSGRSRVGHLTTLSPFL